MFQTFRILRRDLSEIFPLPSANDVKGQECSPSTEFRYALHLYLCQPGWGVVDGHAEQGRWMFAILGTGRMVERFSLSCHVHRGSGLVIPALHCFAFAFGWQPNIQVVFSKLQLRISE